MNKLPKLSALSVEDSGWGFFLCTYKEFRTGRSGSEFLFLSLQDASAQVVAKLMTDVERYKNEFAAGEVQVKDLAAASSVNVPYDGGDVSALVAELRRLLGE